MAKSEAPPSFAEIIEQAQKTPVNAGPLGTDVSSPFPLPLPDDHRVVDMDKDDPAKAPGVPVYDYTAHVKCFNLPQDIEKYETVLNEILNGHAILRFEDRHFTKEGDCVVVVNYLTYTPKPKVKKDKNPGEDDEDGEDGEDEDDRRGN